MSSPYSDSKKEKARLTLESISEAIQELIDWNKDIETFDFYALSPTGRQLVAASCMLVTAIGEGISRCNKIMPDFLDSNFPGTPWKAIIGMRNHIAHGYFEVDTEVLFNTVKYDMPSLQAIIKEAINILKEE